jgi:hypothetical protein
MRSRICVGEQEDVAQMLRIAVGKGLAGGVFLVEAG